MEEQRLSDNQSSRQNGILKEHTIAKPWSTQRNSMFNVSERSGLLSATDAPSGPNVNRAAYLKEPLIIACRL